MFCKKCGDALPDNAKFCDKCGALQIRPDTSSNPFQQEGIKKLESGTSKLGKFVKIGVLGIVALVIIGAVFFYVIPGAPYSTPISTLNDDYMASYSWDGKLEETFIYRVTSSDKFTMLYRNFDFPLVTKSISDPHIEFLTINAPEGTVPYIKDNKGTVSLLNGIIDTNAESKIKLKSHENEVGIFNARGFEPGKYTVVYNFRFHPPVDYDQSAVHLNIKLLDQNTHKAYEQIKIQVPEKSVREIYFSPSHLTIKKNNGMIIATGKLAENEAISFEVILEKDILETLSGFPKYTENITSKTEAEYPHQNPFVP